LETNILQNQKAAVSSLSIMYLLPDRVRITRIQKETAARFTEGERGLAMNSFFPDRQEPGISRRSQLLRQAPLVCFSRRQSLSACLAVARSKVCDRDQVNPEAAL
jgi:hypothetical protein